MLKKVSSKSLVCHKEVVQLFGLFEDLDIDLDVRWISTTLNPADKPSRALLKHVYCFPKWFAQFVRRHFRPDLHLFAGV